MSHCRRLSASAAVLAAAAALLLLAAAPAAAAPAKAQFDNPLPCSCSDVDPREEFIKPAPYTCWQQYKFGQCGMDFIKQTIIEIPEGYCQISCGNCGCCQSLHNVSVAQGLTEFAWAMKLLASTNRTEDLEQPGLMATLLAPDNNAMLNLFAKLGGKEAIMADSVKQDRLKNVMWNHWLPALPVSGAVWTAPFFSQGTKLPSLGGAEAVTVDWVDPNNGNIGLKGPRSSAKIYKKDLYACKGFIQVVDWYMLPDSEQA